MLVSIDYLFDMGNELFHDSLYCSSAVQDIESTITPRINQLYSNKLLHFTKTGNPIESPKDLTFLKI